MTNGCISLVGEFDIHSMHKNLIHFAIDKLPSYIGQRVKFISNHESYYGIVYSWEYILYKYGLIHIMDVRKLEILEDNYDNSTFADLINMIHIHYYIDLKTLKNKRGLLQQYDGFCKYLHLGKCKTEEHTIYNFTNHIHEDVSSVILQLPILYNVDDVLKDINGYDKLILKNNNEKTIFNLNYLELGDKLKDFYVIKKQDNKYIIIENKEFNIFKKSKINLGRYSYTHVVYLDDDE